MQGGEALHASAEHNTTRNLGVEVEHGTFHHILDGYSTTSTPLVRSAGDPTAYWGTPGRVGGGLEPNTG